MKIGRNDACPCGSGKKYKRCCGQTAAQSAAPAPAHSVKQLLALMRAGRYAEVEQGARTLTAQAPDAGMAWKLLALALIRQGKAAGEALEKAAELLPRDAEVHFHLGNAWLTLGQLQAAAASYQRALGIDPGISQAHGNLGLALYNLGQLDQALACYRRSLALAPNAAAHTNLGNALRDLGQFEEAIASHRRALDLEPGLAEARINLGNVLQDVGQINAAIASYRQALELQPSLAAAHNALGSALRRLGRIDEAEASFRRAVLHNPRSTEAHTNLAVVLRMQSRVEEAEQSVGTALKINPNHAASVQFCAELEADRGNFAAAEQRFRRAIEIAPTAVEAWAAIPGLKKMTSADADWMAVAERMAARSLPQRQEISLRYAMGKYFDDLGDFPQAFANYRRANELTQLSTPKHERRQMAEWVDRSMQRYGAAWMSPRGDALADARPIFIVGMPRSGTSLAEQILASHPAVFGAGELPFWSQASAAYEASQDRPLGTLGREYLQQLQRISPVAMHVVDKMPSNFLHLGLIHAALPNARIIHLKRDPIDTCLSIYFQDFDVAHSYANDLGDLADYYQAYLRLMRHWRGVLPAHALLDVPYEALVQDPATWSRRMLEFVALPWDARVLEIDQSRRAVTTRSRWQVRQKINNASVARWRNYREFIGPLAALSKSDDHAAVHPAAE